MQGIVDRIEGGFVVAEAEDGSYKNLPLADFPVAPSEGDTIDLLSMEILESGFCKDDLSDIEQYFK
ncbi:MAG: hypothetical protein Q4C55_10160 [Eubacterium sp.]|nr:hypothetical protein [Eubacterium sp.]